MKIAVAAFGHFLDKNAPFFQFEVITPSVGNPGLAFNVTFNEPP